MRTTQDILKNNESGFTLVELMVCVALVGIMAAIAIPSYTSFQIRARNTEAKIALAAIYTAETSYFAGSNSFSSCLGEIGYAPEGSNRYFAVGFNNGVATNILPGCGPGGGIACNNSNWFSPTQNCTDYQYPATALMPGTPTGQPLPNDASLAAVTSLWVSTSSFIVGAVNNSSLQVADAGTFSTDVAEGLMTMIESDAVAAIGQNPTPSHTFDPTVCISTGAGFSIDDQRNLKAIPQCASAP